ncbi:MAG: thioredoxin family protein, partial [Verrucomicrobia bacterium]|nr:thioredoxin family protein [Verrucomicrobiota bacterium]
YLAPGDFYPAAADDYEIEGATEQLGDPFNPTAFRIRKTVKKFSGNWPAELRGVIVIQNGRQGFQVKFPVAGQPPANASASMAAARAPLSSSAPSGGRGLALELVAAFIGGLILNVMPCVLPVIALKVLAFVREAHSEPRRVRYLGVIYVLGVLVSFLALAGVVIGVRAAGHAAGWGMQFASPVFVVCLTLLVTLVALNLFGVFEVVLGGRAADAAGRLASRHGAPGAFFNGVLATALATSCTSPFLAGAVGFALPQPGAAIVIVFFLAIGLGLATPYVVLIWNPALLKFLPKPGPWMEKFKIAMGFPMLATALWLLNLVYDDYGRNVFWLGLFLVVLALSAWIFGEFVQRGRKHRAIAFVIALLFLGFGYVYALEKGLRWRQPIVPGTPATAETEGGIVWQPWSRAAVTEARAAGHPVLVDFTADWCLTCQINKRIAIETPAVEQELKTLHAVIFTADYTHYSDSITRELNRYHRAGVPLVLVYPKDPSAPAIVLPSILTPGIVLNALQTATKGAPKN